jgi:hypothetical protein
MPITWNRVNTWRDGPATDGYSSTNNPKETLYTDLLTSCWSVTTYNPTTKVRTLTHFNGAVPDKYWDTILPKLSKDVSVITTSGTDNSAEWGHSLATNFKTDLVAKLKAAGREADKPHEFISHDSDEGDDHGMGLQPGTFYIDGKGETGRISVAFWTQRLRSAPSTHGPVYVGSDGP